jgi:hypothetical protein
MDSEAIIAITAILVAVGLPVGGLVMRFALQPLVKDIAAAIRAASADRAGHGDWEAVDLRLARIERALVEQEGLTRRLIETREFDRQIGGPTEPGQIGTRGP